MFEADRGPALFCRVGSVEYLGCVRRNADASVRRKERFRSAVFNVLREDHSELTTPPQVRVKMAVVGLSKLATLAILSGEKRRRRPRFHRF